MDGGECLMIRKLLCTVCAIFMIFTLGFTSFAEGGEEYYEEYDDYSEFEEDYYQNIGIPDGIQKEETKWYEELSVIPLVIGLVAGALTVVILFRKQSIAGRHFSEPPYPTIPDIRHTVISDTNDNTL